MLHAPAVDPHVPGVAAAEAHHAERVFHVLTLAFAADPACRWMYPDQDEYSRYFPVFASALGGAAVARGTAFVREEFSGAALWLAPAASPDEEALMHLFEDSLAGEKRADMEAVIEGMVRHHPDEPHWYLPLIGVVPARQGLGIGAALLRRGLALCDEAGLPAYLESTNPRNQPLYERHGFEAIGEIRVSDCPPIIPMLRQARRSRGFD